jgi:hypothetical protein
MTQLLDYFSDMLAEGENIQAAVAGPGAPIDGATVWFQFAATEQRVLVVELHMSPTGSYRPVQRLYAQSQQIQVNRYPKTADAVSRLELHGFDGPIVMVEIDRTDVFPNVEPFIVAWGGRLGGAGTGRLPKNSIKTKTERERKTLIILASLFIALCTLACACGGIILGLSSVVGSQ